MRRKTRILCSIFGFYLTLALLIPQLTVAFYGHYANRSALRTEFASQAAAEQVLEHVLADGTGIANGCGIPNTVFADVFSAGQLQQDMADALSAALDGQAYAPDLTQSMELLTQNINQALSQLEDVADPAELAEEINVFCEQIQNIYQRYINLSVYSKFDPLLQTVKKWLNLALLVAGVTGLLCVMLLGRLARQKGTFLRELAFSLIATGGLNALLCGGILGSGVLGRLQVSPAYFRDALGNYLHDGLRLSVYVAAATIVLGLLLFLLAAIRIRRSTKYQNRV